MQFLTDELPGTGGRIKVHPADFVVTEIPLYEPCGEGDHVYLHIEKQGIGSLEAADQIARALGRPRHVVGIAGLKDAQAVTQQWMSIERVDPDLAARLHLPGIRILAVSRHRNKLKIGHLAGNRFEVRVRGCRPGAKAMAERILSVLSQRGVPNWFDYQRFGRRGDNHLLGRALVLGRYQEFCDRFLGGPSEADSPRLRHARSAYDAHNLAEAKKLFTGNPDHLRVLMTLMGRRNADAAARALPKQLARLLVGAFQSDIFNAVLARRMDSIDRVESGDLAYIHPHVPRLAGKPLSSDETSTAAATKEGPHGGAVFLVESPEAEAPRAQRFEISPTGPIVGHRVTLASGRPGEIERHILAEKSITPDDFERVKALRLRGDRRPLRIPVIDPEVSPVGDDILVRFILPSGAYATVVLAEITKSEI